MPKPYSVDLRARVIEDVESGASRREAGTSFVMPAMLEHEPESALVAVHHAGR